MSFSRKDKQSPGLQNPGDFWLTILKQSPLFHKIPPIFIIISNSNPVKQLKFEFKINNIYPDICNLDFIQKTALLIDFTLHTVFELDYFGLIPKVIVLVENERPAHAHTRKKHPCKSFFLCKSNPKSD